MKRLILFLLFIGLHLEISAQVDNDSMDSKAKVIIYRRPEFNFLRFGIKVNGEEAVKNIKPKSYCIIEMPIGLTTIETFGHPLNEGKQYVLTLEPGEIYYLEAFTEFQAWLVTLHLLRRSEEVGQEAIKKLNGVVIPKDFQKENDDE